MSSGRISVCLALLASVAADGIDWKLRRKCEWLEKKGADGKQQWFEEQEWYSGLVSKCKQLARKDYMPAMTPVSMDGPPPELEEPVIMDGNRRPFAPTIMYGNDHLPSEAHMMPAVFPGGLKQARAGVSERCAHLDEMASKGKIPQNRVQALRQICEALRLEPASVDLMTDAAGALHGHVLPPRSQSDTAYASTGTSHSELEREANWDAKSAYWGAILSKLDPKAKCKMLSKAEDGHFAEKFGLVNSGWFQQLKKECVEANYDKLMTTTPGPEHHTKMYCMTREMWSATKRDYCCQEHGMGCQAAPEIPDHIIV